jgi:galactokinase
VEQASRVLAAGDLAAFGRLLTESHSSLRDDYEVTGPYLDAIAGAALAAPGCLGARMTGAGFGGCAIALVEQAAVPVFTASVRSTYSAATGLEPAFYVTHAADGVHETTGKG